MASPGDGVSVPHDRDVLRTPTPPKGVVPEQWRPTWQEFRPSSDDEEDAIQRGGSVRVSVWDARLTTIEQAKSFRTKETWVLTGLVTSVLEAGRYSIVYDPLHGAMSLCDGADGHAGIEGLSRVPNEPKAEWKKRLQAVANCFRL